ncbi:hypothetical protein AB205_0007710 [Aquarana catesbeiana]|uniref:Uncharacterized protein n=1 Tax=Aquarana catesbeiana TaxID=8400 RepID=A0A2G9S7Z2_AQUCT|nr:hypothetical protein AB205_0007710 [Aquarana catesbeiana]
MFHIPVSAIKYPCAKYTYFFLHRREDSEDTTHQRRPWTPHLRKKGKSPKPNQRRRRKTLWKLSPQQVIVVLWKRNVTSPVKVPRSSSGR